jgi:hypothetical protein
MQSIYRTKMNLNPEPYSVANGENSCNTSTRILGTKTGKGGSNAGFRFRVPVQLRGLQLLLWED